MPWRIGFVNGNVLEAALKQLAVDLAQFSLVADGENDRVGLRVDISGGRFAGCVDDLGSQKAER